MIFIINSINYSISKGNNSVKFTKVLTNHHIFIMSLFILLWKEN
jgi:hypothetical protein